MCWMHVHVLESCWDTVGGELLYTVSVCVTNCVFAYCGALVSTCLCNTLWCTSVEHSDTPEYTAVGCRMGASDVAALSHSG